MRPATIAAALSPSSSVRCEEIASVIDTWACPSWRCTFFRVHAGGQRRGRGDPSATVHRGDRLGQVHFGIGLACES